MDEFQVADHLTVTERIFIIYTAVSVSAEDWTNAPPITPDFQRLIDEKTINSSDQRRLCELEVAIDLIKGLLDVVPQSHRLHALLLMGVADLLLCLYMRDKMRSDLHESSIYARRALEATESDSPDWEVRLSFLGIMLAIHYFGLRSPTDLEEAIRINHRYLALENGKNSSEHLRVMDILYRTKHIQNMDGSGLETALSSLRNRIQSGIEDDQHRYSTLELEAQLLVERFKRTGNVSSLEEAVDSMQNVFENTPEDHKHRQFRGYLLISYLGLLAEDRASQNLGRSKEDYYEESLDLAKIELKPVLSDAIRRDKYLSTALQELEEKYWVSKDTTYLDKAIALVKEAVNLRPALNPRRMLHLEYLEDLLEQRFNLTGETKDLNEIVRVSRLVVDEAPRDDEETLSLRLYSLAEKLRIQYQENKSVDTLREAIQHSKYALEISPNNTWGTQRVLQDIGTWYGLIHGQTQDKADFENHICFLKRGLEADESGPFDQMNAVGPLIRGYASDGNWDEAYAIACTGVSIMLKISLRSLGAVSRKEAIRRSVGTASFAAGLAFHRGQDPLVALDLIEKGRNIFANSLDDLRVEVSAELKQLHPRLAEEYINLRYQVGRPGLTLLQDRAQDQGREKASKQLDSLISEISKQPGFENFLRSPGQEEIRGAAGSGPIVIINTCPLRCDALIIKPNEVRGLPLPQLEHQDILNHAVGNPNGFGILQWLWDTIAGPVLDALGFTQPPEGNGPWPRVWWIPIGPLAKFPIHAAGYHHSGTNDTVMDRVASSYSTSIKSIIQARRRPVSMTRDKMRAVLVSVPKSKGCTPLPFVEKEVQEVGNICRSMRLDVVEPQPRKETVASLIPGCTIFHFAGHGQASASEPSLSQLLLEDSATEGLTVAAIQEMNLRSGLPFLAYLSACGTGNVKQFMHLDESTHLISACQLAGFRHVIGTLWEVNDEGCVRVAKRVYEEMLNRGLSDEAVCLGLHEAIREFREEWRAEIERKRNGEKQTDEIDPYAIDTGRDIVQCDDEDQHVPDWVPYIHFGV